MDNKSVYRRKRILILALIILVLVLGAASRVSLLTVFQQYPTVTMVNQAGCVLQYDTGYELTDPRGVVVLETPWQGEAALGLLVCD